ncbi:putative FBD-associated F-box protein [Citrus sinensis]|uniref:FBD-associated F-box protein n=1 Tax=Citrus sinensis TaxID=2711 RepID=A0ACB8NZP8_CITSI|nr:putative FBD-associated F-box protein [Citrus sinensis]
MENALQRSPIISKLTCGVCYNVGGEDGDRLSNLPEPIIHHIFSFLETIDVVRASAVSRKWRYLWLSIPYLNFNVHNICSNPLERWSLQTTNEKFKDFVNWVLLFQNGSVSIHRFRLSCLNRVDDYTFYRWIAPIKLPRSLVTCESLVSLKLDFGNREHQGVLNLPTCVGFSRLKSLDLQHVEVLDYNLFREFLSSCPLLENFSPLLENLKMDSCCFPDLKILDISSNSLKSLTLERIEFGGDELDNYKLKIACSNLESFNIFAPLLPDFTLESLNSLQNAFIFLETIGEYMEAKEICHRMSKILNGLRDVKVLKLSCTLYQFLNAILEQRSYFSASFNNLKSLILCVTTAEWTVPLIIRLLNHSPNLEVLTIYFDSDEYYDDWEIPDKVILCLTCHLKTVELIDFSGNENELELVRFLLKNGHVLQKLRIISAIMKFTISSSSVALKFLEPKPFLDFFNRF